MIILQHQGVCLHLKITSIPKPPGRIYGCLEASGGMEANVCSSRMVWEIMFEGSTRFQYRKSSHNNIADRFGYKQTRLNLWRKHVKTSLFIISPFGNSSFSQKLKGCSNIGARSQELFVSLQDKFRTLHRAKLRRNFNFTCICGVSTYMMHRRLRSLFLLGNAGLRNFTCPSPMFISDLSNFGNRWNGHIKNRNIIRNQKKRTGTQQHVPTLVSIIFVSNSNVEEAGETLSIFP